MPLDTAWPVPFLLDPQNLAVDSATTFVVSALLALMINAEAQAFAGALLGDTRVGAKDRFHFNAFLHLDILGSICYLVGGFGWPKAMEIDASKFRYPRLYTLIARLAGPLANLLLASIGSSVAMLFKAIGSNPRVFLMVIGVNITTAIYNLLPLSPLAMGFLLSKLISSINQRIGSLFIQAGPYLILAIVLMERLTHRGIISLYLDPIIKGLFAVMRNP